MCACPSNVLWVGKVQGDILVLPCACVVNILQYSRCGPHKPPIIDHRHAGEPPRHLLTSATKGEEKGIIKISEDSGDLSGSPKLFPKLPPQHPPQAWEEVCAVQPPRVLHELYLRAQYDMHEMGHL